MTASPPSVRSRVTRNLRFVALLATVLGVPVAVWQIYNQWPRPIPPPPPPPPSLATISLLVIAADQNIAMVVDWGRPQLMGQPATDYTIICPNGMRFAIQKAGFTQIPGDCLSVWLRHNSTGKMLGPKTVTPDQNHVAVIVAEPVHPSNSRGRSGSLASIPRPTGNSVTEDEDDAAFDDSNDTFSFDERNALQ